MPRRSRQPKPTTITRLNLPNLFLRARSGPDARTGMEWTTGEQWTVRDSMRFTRFVPQDVGPEKCWEWRGSRDRQGYGKFTAQNRQLRAHRAAFEQRHGPIPNDLDVDHICENKSCVNPRHLQAVTRGENTRLSCRTRRTTCKRGHLWTPENSRWRRNGTRTCIACERYRRERRRLSATTDPTP